MDKKAQSQIRSIRFYSMPYTKLFLIIFITTLSITIYGAKPVELNSTIMLFNEDDLDKCRYQLDKAQKLENSHVSFLASIYADLDDKKVKRYYLKNKHAQIKHAQNTNIKKYQKKLLRCVERALKNFQHVYVTIQLNHINDASNWRNYFDYDPLEKYQGYSLYDIAMKPFKKITSKKLKRVYLSLTSEMGRSIKLYPQSYSRIFKMLPESLNTGVSINFNQSFGSFLDSNLKLPVLNEFDFIGVSAYDMISPKCGARDFQRNIRSFRKKLVKYGLSKPENQWRIHITEIGIGGGAPTANMTSRMPYKGIYGAYDKKRDPWQDPGYKKARKKFYGCLLEFLKETNLVQAAFIWNANSWDVQGLYPFSESYKSVDITKMIQSYNNASHSL